MIALLIIVAFVLGFAACFFFPWHFLGEQDIEPADPAYVIDSFYWEAKQRMLDADIQRRYERARE